MARRITDTQREAVLALLAQGHDRETIAARVGVTPGQVSAVAAHIKMGTYRKHGAEPNVHETLDSHEVERVDGVFRQIDERRTAERPPNIDQRRIVIGRDMESGETVTWDPDPSSGLANPHVLILGESGYGKTYAITCLLSELAQRGICSIVFDYAQGFSVDSAPPAFVEHARPVEIHASRDGVAINPFQLFQSDVHGPVNVAQRIADTFQRVYSQLGIQQHAILRQAVLDAMMSGGLLPNSPNTWGNTPPAFGSLQPILDSYAGDPSHPQRRIASAVASHISTMFVFNTFREDGLRLDWGRMLSTEGQTFVVQLKGLEQSLERVVTEFLIWNLIGYVESLGPGPMRCFIVLDEAHKLAFSAGSPAEKLLREGRKFGLGVILASQQPEDFGPVAYANTATKLVFQISDERSTVSRQLARKVIDSHSASEIGTLVTKLPRGHAYFLADNIGRVVRIESFEERVNRWEP